RVCGWPNIHPGGSLARDGRPRTPCGKGRPGRRACRMRGRDHGAMELTDFEALSFDCYGTLIDWETGLTAVLVPWARQRGLSLGGEERRTGYAAAGAAAEAGPPADRYPDILARSMRALGGTLGAEVTNDDAARLAGSVPDWPAFPDSAAALAALGRRFKLIILSNVDRASFASSAAPLGARFTSVITRPDARSYKPDPPNFPAPAPPAAPPGLPP